ncbi:MAG: hypothetical protein ACXWLH_01390 [Candidatus Saccharimonadales bacterium]
MSKDAELDFQAARLQFFIAMEQSAADRYALLATDKQQVDMFATAKAEEYAGYLREGIGDDFDVIEPNLKKGFYRIFMDFTEVGDHGEVDTVNELTLTEAFLDVAQTLEMRWDAIAHEWSLLAVAMKAWEHTHSGTPFKDPSTRFAYLYALVKEKGSASGHLDEARKAAR